MAYQALYRKYRPQTFGEVYGQKAIIRTLENALAEGKISHAYLFCGPRGTGKTTMARLLAKALNCQEGIGHQCGKCASCLALAQGDHPDVIEIDAASNSRVEDVRDLISQVNYQPILGRYRVYIIDEVHNMSGSAFNALLKTLEEPPANVVFILATTEPQKILPTILSRVQRFDFSKVDDADLVADMVHIMAAEKIDYELPALEKIASLADGGVRDSLSLLDQAVSYCGAKVTASAVDSLFGLIDVATVCGFIQKAHAGDVSGLLTSSRALYGRGMDIVRMTKDLVVCYKDLLIAKAGGDKSLLKKLTVDQAASFQAISVSEIERNIQTLIKGQRDYRYAQDLQDAFELTLLALAIPNDSKVMASAQQPAPTIPSVPIASVPLTPMEEPKPMPDSVPAKKAETPKPEPAPVAEPLKEAPAAPVADKASSAFDPDEVLNLMTQGNKALKAQMTKAWDSLQSPDDDHEKALNALKLGKPSVVNAEGLVLVASTKSFVALINNPDLQSPMQDILDQAFHIRPQILAMDKRSFSNLVLSFREKMQANTLPTKHPVNLLNPPKAEPSDHGKSSRQETNASRFLRELEGGK